MKRTSFFGRHAELAALETAFSEHSGIVAVCGMPRTGKTSLIREFLNGKRFWYLSAMKQPLDLNLREFSEQISVISDMDIRFGDWIEMFCYFSKTEKEVLVLDGFSELTCRDPSFLDMVCRAYGEFLSPNGKMIVLCGCDSDSFDVLKSRKGTCIQLNPFSFSELCSYGGTGSFSGSLEMYAVTGGMPGCIRAVSEMPDITWESLIDKDGLFFREYDMILCSSAGHGGRARGILKAISEGNARLSEIAERTGVSGRSLGPYLRSMEDSGIIERRVPVTESDSVHSRKGCYHIVNPYVRFWCRFLAPHLSSLELDDSGPVLKDLHANFQDFEEGVFRDICMDYVRQRTGEHIAVGECKDEKVDILALDHAGRFAFAGICRYGKRPAGIEDVQGLYDAIKRIPELEGYRVEYGVFSASGFDDGVDSEGDLRRIDISRQLYHF